MSTLQGPPHQEYLSFEDQCEEHERQRRAIEEWWAQRAAAENSRTASERRVGRRSTLTNVAAILFVLLFVAITNLTTDALFGFWLIPVGGLSEPGLPMIPADRQ